MVDFDDGAAGPQKTPSGKNMAETIAAVRQRGMLNAGLDIVAQEFEKEHPEQRVKWEFYRPNTDGGTDMVQMREGMGFHVVDAAELPNQTESSKKSGPVRRGDLVLMAAPKEVFEELVKQDAEAARSDVRSSEAAFKESLDKRTVRLSSGERDQAVGVGSIKTRTEEILVPASTTPQGGS